MTIRTRLRRLSLLSTMVFMFLAAVGTLHAQPQPEAGQQKTLETPAQAAPEQEKDENEAYRHSATVKKLGQMMGISTEAAATTFTIFNFAVLAFALGYVLLKTLPKMFRDRTTAIQKHLVDARTATEEANARLTGVEDRLAKLDGQIVEMRVQAEKDAATEEQRMRAAVAEEKAKILAAADQEIASASLQAQRQLQKYAAELAIEQAGRRLVVSAETDRLLVQNFARRLGVNDKKGGQN